MTILSKKTVWSVQDIIGENVVFTGTAEINDVDESFSIHGIVENSETSDEYNFSFSIRRDGFILGFVLENVDLDKLKITQEEVFDFIFSFGEQMGINITK